MMSKKIEMAVALALLTTAIIVVTFAVSPVYAQAQSDRLFDQGVVTLTDRPNIEPIQLTGYAHTAFYFLPRGNGEVVVFDVNGQGYKAVGQITGNQYVFTTSSHSVFTSSVVVGGATESTATGGYNLISVGQGHSALSISVQFTIYYTVIHGTVTANVNNFNVRCA